MGLAESIQAGRPALRCALCGVGVYLVAMPEKGEARRFFFRHTLEDGRCPAVTRSKLSKDEIEARKYNGAKESDAHIEMKGSIAESLRCDQNFSKVAVEEVWHDKDRAAWRKPDVSALWKGQIRVAFEIQLSTTFLHVIAARRLFYLKQGGLLCWIFKRYDKEDARLTQEDVFYNNNRNLFLASERTLQASRESKALVLDCHWQEPRVARDGRITTTWHERLTRFEELALDPERQRVFLFDYDGAEAVCQAQSSDGKLRKRFELWWAHFYRSGAEDADERWGELCSLFRQRGIELPRNPERLHGLAFGVLSAHAGKPIGCGHPNLIGVAHTVEKYHKAELAAFLAAIVAYDRTKRLRQQDSSGKLARKLRGIREQLKAQSGPYARDPALDPLIEFMFPKTWAVLCRWLDDAGIARLLG